jgi:hypothetical protein
MNYAATVLRMGVWPPDACLQGLASNHPMLLRSKVVVGERWGKGGLDPSGE